MATMAHALHIDACSFGLIVPPAALTASSAMLPEPAWVACELARSTVRSGVACSTPAYTVADAAAG